MWRNGEGIELPKDAELLTQLSDAGVRARRLSPDEHREREGAWRRVYGRAFRRPLRHRHGARAVQEFLGQPTARWLLIPFLSDVPGTPVNVLGPTMSAFECDGWPVALGNFSDVEFFVSSPDLEWTFVRTHEDFALGGPFFVRSEWLDGPEHAATIDERNYWILLMFRVSGEFAGMADKALRGFWCDGFEPEQFTVDDEGASVSGRAWIARGPQSMERWRFVLLTGCHVSSREFIDWNALLPAEQMTGWLSLDAVCKTLKIHPAAAYPDPPTPKRGTKGTGSGIL